MRVTLIVDASFTQDGAAGWGARYKHGNMEQGVSFGGGFKYLMPSAHAAELCAISNALHELLSRHPESYFTEVMLQSDCLTALKVLRGIPGVTFSHFAGAKRHNMAPQNVGLSAMDKYVKKVVHGMMSSQGFTLEVRHVKGHTNGTGRFWVNGLCDRIAKTHRKSARVGELLPFNEGGDLSTA